MNEYPIDSDNLFVEETDPMMGAWLQNPTSKFFLYSEGYKQAGDISYEHIMQKEFYSQFLVYPMIFNYRQYIELRLKELITMGYKFLELKQDFKDTHDLKILWESYRNDILEKIGEFDAELLKNVERLILEFNKIDSGFAFRYPVTRGPNRQQTITMSTVDLHNFKSTFDKLARFLENQWDHINGYQELKNEYIHDMMSEMYRESGY